MPSTGLTPEFLRAFLEKHAKTQKQLALDLPVPIKTLEAWLAGTNRMPLYLYRALRDLEKQWEQ